MKAFIIHNFLLFCLAREFQSYKLTIIIKWIGNIC